MDSKRGAGTGADALQPLRHKVGPEGIEPVDRGIMSPDEEGRLNDRIER